MKKHITYIAVLLSSWAWSQISVESEINKATIYLSGAIVERSVDQSLTAGTHTLIFENLPSGLNPRTIKLDVPEGVRLLKIDYRYRQPDELEYVDLSTYAERLMEIDDQIIALQDRRVSLNEDLEFVLHNSDLNGVQAQDLRAADEYLQRRRREIRAAIREVDLELEALKQTSQRTRVEIAEVESSLEKTQSLLEVEVSLGRAIQGNYTLSYYTPLANWTPYYNVNVSGLDEDIEIEMLGTVRQNTGEDWDNINLELSTGNPSVGTQERELTPWYLGDGQRYFPTNHAAPSGRFIPVSGSFHAFVTDGETGRPLEYAELSLEGAGKKYFLNSDERGQVFIENIPQGQYQLTCDYYGFSMARKTVSVSVRPSLVRIGMRSQGSSTVDLITGGITIQYESPSIATRDKSEEGFLAEGSNFSRRYQPLNLVYQIDQKYSIQSNGLGVKIQVNTQRRPAEFVTRVRPALSQNAFLLARVSDWESLNLEAGPINYFIEGSFNGSSYFDPYYAPDTLELALGVDPNVSFDRVRVNPMNTDVAFSSNDRESFEYRITLRNLHSEPHLVVIEDQFPVSSSPDIKVRERVAEGAEINQNTGWISWEQQVAPNADWIVGFKFLIVAPEKLSGVNLPQ